MTQSAYRFRKSVLRPALACCALTLALRLPATLFSGKQPDVRALFTFPPFAAESRAEEPAASDAEAKKDAKASEEPKEKAKDDQTAKDEAKGEKDAKDTTAKEEKPQPGDPVRADLSGSDPAERALLQNLAKRRRELEEWSASVALKESILNAGEQKLNVKLQQLGKLKEELKTILAEYNAKENAKILRLVKIYENMPPKDAARIFDATESETLLQVLEKMKEAKAAPVLAAMQTERVSLLTRQLMDRRRAGEDEEAASRALGPEGPSSTAGLPPQESAPEMTPAPEAP